MSSAKLIQDLSNCLINFDRRVLMTELLDEYKLTYEEVNKIIESYIVDRAEKDDIKYDKRYLIHAFQEGELKKEIFKIVEEIKLKEWLQKLHSTEFSLYSVEVAGGAKAAAPVFKPMRVAECSKTKRGQATRESKVSDVVENPSTSHVKNEVKIEKKTSVTKSESPKETLNSAKKTETTIKKTSPKTEISTTTKKGADKKSNGKKGINNFFAPSTAASKKIENTKDTKKASSVTKASTPKKMNEYFKKQADQPKSNTENIEKLAANTSVQLFDEDEPQEDEVSSDEEEKLEALKRDIISSDVEMEDGDESQVTTSKRRRILDSDDEEDPPLKQEKFDISEEAKEEEVVAETYLDEDGFVITKKPKQKATSSKKSPAAIKAPPVTIKTTPTEKKKSSLSLNKDSKAATNTTAKTKQAGIMNFFTKK